MLKIYTSVSKIDNGKDTINKINLFFNNNKGDIVITPEIESLMLKIDNAKVEGDNIINDFGKCDISNLSTGVKALILMLTFKDRFNYDITCCGPNILEKAFDIMDKYNIDAVLNHIDIPFKVKYAVNVNNNPVKDLISGIVIGVKS